VKVAIRPKTSPYNRYVELFASVFEKAGWEVTTLTWRIAPVLRGGLMILHWPDTFYASSDTRSRLLHWSRVVLMAVSRRLYGVRWVWVVHNLVPHDHAEGDPRLWRSFTSQLDGLVFLSCASRKAFVSDHPDRVAIPHLITRHGEYRTGALTPPSPWRHPNGPIRLQFVGQLRPYKNLEQLVDAARNLDADTQLGVMGFGSEDVGAELRRRSAGAVALQFDLRSAPLDEAELERVVDASDAIILPYRRILNSGSAIFALSRNRAVIAPALGGLAELRDTVGDQWVYLYEGELTSEVLRSAAAWVRTASRPRVCRLDAYDWAVVGEEVLRFAEGVMANAAG